MDKEQKRSYRNWLGRALSSGRLPFDYKPVKETPPQCPLCNEPMCFIEPSEWFCTCGMTYNLNPKEPNE